MNQNVSVIQMRILEFYSWMHQIDGKIDYLYVSYIFIDLIFLKSCLALFSRISNLCLTLSQCDPNPEKHANAGTRESEGSAVDALQHDAGLSPHTPNEEETTEHRDAAPQSTQSSSHPHGNSRDKPTFQSQFSASAEPPDSQVLPGKSESSSQPASSPDASSQSPGDPGKEEHIEKDVDTKETEQSLNTDPVPASSSNNDVPPGPSVPPDSPALLVMDQNKAKSPTTVDEAVIEGSTLQIPSSVSEPKPLPGSCKTQEEPDRSHEELVNTKSVNLVEASVQPQPSTNQTSEEAKTLQKTSGQSETQHSYNQKMFGPYPSEASSLLFI